MYHRLYEDHYEHYHEQLMNETQQKSKKGFASMSEEKRKEIARKGGLAVAQNREHMAEIGRKGGQTKGGLAKHSTHGKQKRKK